MFRYGGESGLYGEFIYDQIVKKDHILRIIDKEIQFDELAKAISHCYCWVNGRPPLEPELMIRATTIQFFYNYTDRQLEAALNENIPIKWFLGYELDEAGFDHSSLHDFRQRLHTQGAEELFDRIVDQLIEKGFISKAEAQYTDSTHIYADITIRSLTQLIQEACKKVFDYLGQMGESLATAARTVVDEKALYETAKGYRKKAQHDALLNQVAKEAQKLLGQTVPYLGLDHLQKKRLYGRFHEAVELLQKLFDTRLTSEPQELNDDRSASEPKESPAMESMEAPVSGSSTLWVENNEEEGIVSLHDVDCRFGAKHKKWTVCGYKDHALVTQRGFITAVEVTAMNVYDGDFVVGLAEKQKERHGIVPSVVTGDSHYGSTTNRAKMAELGTQLVAPLVKGKVAAERFTSFDFTYDAEAKTVTCPQGVTTKKVYDNRPNQCCSFVFPESACRSCPLASQCISEKAKFRKVTISDDFEERASILQFNRTAPYKEFMQNRAIIVEGKQAEQKRFHGLGRAKSNRLIGVKIQALWTAIAVNLKRMVKLHPFGQIGAVCPFSPPRIC